MAKGKLYIIPVPISESPVDHVMPAYNASVIGGIRIFVVEKITTARRFLRKMDPSFPIDDCQFYEPDKHRGYDLPPGLADQFREGKTVGLMSESGYPGIADPGTRVVALAHRENCEVVPLVGPGSLFLALACSGMSGQGFTFHGYLPKKPDERVKRIREISADCAKTGYTQLFIETPYRNEQLMADLLKHSSPSLMLTVASDITGPGQAIITRPVRQWQKQPFRFTGDPCIFVLGRQ